MSPRFRALLVLAALVGVGSAQVPRANAVPPGGDQQCWYEVGVDPEYACHYCFDECMGTGYVCCIGSAQGAE